MEQKLPYGVHLIEQFVEKRYPDGASGLGVVLGEAMDKDTGRYYRVRWEAYEKHFDHVITELCIKPVYKDLETDEFKLPPYQITASKALKGMRVKITFEYDDRPDLNFELGFDYWHLYESLPFDHLSHSIHRIFKNDKDDVVYGKLWASLSQDAKELFLYELGATHQAPHFTPRSASDEIKNAELMQEPFYPTDKGHNLLRWLRETGIVS